MITTLNALEPNSIRIIDTVYPENSRREKVQSPKFTELSFFRFNKYESIVKSLHGRVQDKYKELFNGITGTLSFIEISNERKILFLGLDKSISFF